MVLNQFTYFSILGLPLIAWGGMITFSFLLATVYTGLKNKPIKTHKKIAMITSTLAVFHGLFAILAYI